MPMAEPCLVPTAHPPPPPRLFFPSLSFPTTIIPISGEAEMGGNYPKKRDSSLWDTRKPMRGTGVGLGEGKKRTEKKGGERERKATTPLCYNSVLRASILRAFVGADWRPGWCDVG